MIAGTSSGIAGWTASPQPFEQRLLKAAESTGGEHHHRVPGHRVVEHRASEVGDGLEGTGLHPTTGHRPGERLGCRASWPSGTLCGAWTGGDVDGRRRVEGRRVALEEHAAPRRGAARLEAHPQGALGVTPPRGRSPSAARRSGGGQSPRARARPGATPNSSWRRLTPRKRRTASCRASGPHPSLRATAIPASRLARL